MKTRKIMLTNLMGGALLLLSACAGFSHLIGSDSGKVAIVRGKKAGGREALAAREIQRYLYLRTGGMARIVESPPKTGDVIVLATGGQGLGAQEYSLSTTSDANRRVLRITGGDGLGTLYGAYRFAEHLGVRFYLHGDVIPDERLVNWRLPELDETGKPLFALRGIQPFHDFTEGPDWWSADDYKAYCSQLAKLRMNFMGLHTYPEGGVGPEPAVWIGLPQDVNQDGTVKFSYPSRWASTSGGSWGYAPTKSSDFSAGAALLFENDDFGAPPTDGYRPMPGTVEDSNAVFNRAAAMFKDAFTYGHGLGIQFCMGTETPLTIPKALQEHLKQKGMDPGDPGVVGKLYEGMFRRIAAAYPLDYYWLWTPEGWTWSGTKPEEVNAAVADIKAAVGALKNAGSPFGFATCGWVLGPPSDRTLFDKILAKDAAISCINQEVGFSPVEPGFARAQGRPQWAIPWMEDDPGMIIPQLWAGRMRRDAADAYAYGCTGLMGIHWRTKVLAPNVAALAAAGWDQKAWNADFGRKIKPPEPATTDIHIGGQTADYPNNSISATDEDAVYQSCLYDLKAYRLRVPNGTYNVTLKFCEVAYEQAGKRVFGVKVQGKTVLDKLDVFARAGANKTLDFTFKDVAVASDELVIEFVQQVEYPFIAGIVIEGRTAASNQIKGVPFTRKINCGGGKYKDYEADLPGQEGGAGFPDKPRDLPCGDFYQDWCRAQFGPDAAEGLAALFVRLDGGPGKYDKPGTALPRPADWIGGPGGIIPDDRPWEDEKERYGFVDEMAALRPNIEGAGNLERFDYWLNTFRYLRAVGQIGCTRGELDRIMKEMNAEKDPAKKKQLAEQKALPLRIELARQWERMMTLQLAATDTPGEMGTVANLEQHVRRNTNDRHFLDLHDRKIVEALGAALPSGAQPGERYMGQPRLIVPTVRTQVGEGESLTIKVIVLDNERPKSAALHWRPMGRGGWGTIPLRHVDRGVHTVTLPPAEDAAFEYYIQATTAKGQQLVWPATAPEMSQTVVVHP